MKKKIAVLFLLSCLIISSGFGCKWTPKAVQEKMQPITLNYWRAWDGPDDLAGVISAYNAVHTNITINYRKFRYEEYEQALLEAWAEDRGPDIFSINSTWIEKYASKIAVMPTEISLAYPVTKGTIKQEVVPEIRTVQSITQIELKKKFLDTVYNDVILDYTNPQTKVVEKRIYGLPFSVDTLAMYYNRDLLNNAGISKLSEYWNQDLQQQVKRLTKQDVRGNIIQSGMALGTGNNIDRSADILAVLMTQAGAKIIDDNKRVSFAEFVSRENYNPGLDAIRFYSDFANPAKDVYSWNNKMNNSLDMFINGKLAVMFGYSYLLPTIKTQSPKLNFEVQALPQIQLSDAQVNMADYWVETVSQKSKYTSEAWDFIQFVATNPDVVKLYLEQSERPTALRELVDEQKKSADIGVFAEQLLTAKTWYRGKNFSSAEQAFKDMLDAVAENPSRLEAEARITAGKIKQTL